MVDVEGNTNEKSPLELVILGSSNAIPDENHENSHMVLAGSQRTVLVDSPGHPLLRLKQSGLAHQQLTDIILTHFHPDHVSGVASLLMSLWLLGRKAPLNIYGLEHTLERTEKLMGFYDWETWPGFFPVVFHRVPEEEKILILEDNEVSIYASPVRHIIPTIGLRFVSQVSNRTIVYSCDTEPCIEVRRLAADSDILIHEASGETFGHSSAAQAGEIAQISGVGELLLIHYPTQGPEYDRLVDEASRKFDGPVRLAFDFMRLGF